MKRRRFAAEQIIKFLNGALLGVAVEGPLRNYNLS